MKASVPLAALTPVLTAANSLGTRRYSVPVLAGVKLTVTGDVLTVARFDYETSVTGTLRGGMADGVALVSSKGLADAVKALAPKGAAGRSALVHLALDGNHVTVSVSDGPTVRLDTLAVDDYPTLPTPGTRSVALLTAADVKRIVAGVVPAAGTDQTIPMLTGVQLVIEPGGVSVAQATNRYMAARLALDPADHAGRSSATLVPASVWKLVGRLANGYDGYVMISDDATRGTHDQIITFVSGHVTVQTRALDPDFPKLAALYPDASNRASVPVKPLADAVKMAARMAGKTVPVRLEITDDSTIDVAITGGVDATENFRTSVRAEVSQLRQINLRTAFDPGYLATILASFAGEVSWQVTAPLKPSVFTDGRLAMLIMPMRTGE